ncbi:DUF1653 domain-containing protein [Desulfovibrio mangrovi]|uniref:DUF1653 domain-containing protein n=1 Tax=Desulfovibrio mangrovi TaxID=2976983 RepID=UPI0022456F85|nr:DUF1653 domain-containing protein [Desulfovibrio mangrovi]UZP68406.1 DUF1653 domain-containing protein [Desulfovibrio mangrovi]
MTAFYRHFKGKYYQVVGTGLDTATEGQVVVYRTLYLSDYSLFTRPYDEFFGTVDRGEGSVEPRFAPVDAADLPEDAQLHVLSVLPLP